MRNFTLHLHKYNFVIVLIGFVFIITIESPIESPLLSIQLANFLTNNSIVEYVLAQPPPANTSITIINNISEEQNKSKIIKAFGHFANNQIEDGGIVTWIQGGFWELKINDKVKSNVTNNNNSQINNTSSNANFIANFTMIKPDGSLSHKHNIQNFISDMEILTEKDIVVMGTADIYSDDKNNEYKNVPLTIHLMGKKVLGLTIDVDKTKGHFSSTNEMFGTLISGIGFDTSAADNSINKSMLHHDTGTNDSNEKESMTMTMMQH